MRVEIWSDIVCPWCYIGKRRFETALARFEHRDEVEVVWRSFELDPKASATDVDLLDHLSNKYGVSRDDAAGMNTRVTEVAAGEGLGFRLDIARRGNTFDAHRLLHLAGERGVQDELKERLLAAYQTGGLPIADHETLVALATEVGIEEAEAQAVLAGDAFAGEVRADEADARRLGVTAVPTFVVDRRFGVSGAQPAEALLALLDKGWAERGPLEVVTVPGAEGGADACGPEGCDLPG